ncbi:MULTISPECIES: succinic semialdehyde dehydrogenase [Tsukamurella]|uniref:Succinic semialdehyde dehydrogenase n=1 Tax=Tsukamurella strandjordii TaxID=147577 RepID=A0AA90NDK9_9ACTN|nr:MULTISPECIES: succinic semialdehyde dehydrogenase [Tsukamurella]MDP0398457.1 succinic semialdehyde dehydrogenase [Tsukamurella strandjordii]GIZ97684.1 succinic semialdehyde dehydrogenase [Tsukamurella sp. TY48]
MASPTQLRNTLPPRITDEVIGSLTALVVADGSREAFPMIEVFTGAPIGPLPQSTPADVTAAFETARTAQQEWAQRPLEQRLAVFKRLHELILENNELLVDLIQSGTGKNRRMAFEESCDVPMVISHYLKAAPRLLRSRRRGGPVPVLSNSVELHRPKGVIGVIAPWNFPFAMALSDAIPALIAGNGVVLKPDNKTALAALYGVELLRRAGAPEGLFQVVCGQGPDVGPTLIDESDFVMFTGSSATGATVGERAGKNLIGCSLELGGKNPMIVLDDVDLDEAVTSAIFAVFANAGQACMHIERMYIHDSIFDEFSRRFVAAAGALSLGATYDYEPDMGSLASPDQLRRVSAHVEDARAKGATVLCGGRARTDVGPAFYAPTVLTGVTPDMHLATAETFGPVVSLFRYSTDEEAVRLANDTRYGLNASVWAKDLRRAARIGAQLEAGNVNINDGFAASFASKGTPSGGWKASGVGVRHGDAGLLKYTDTTNLATLKKQVYGVRPGQTYTQYAKQTIQVLRLMRKLRIR